ncbi:MAG: hypothetical protein ACJAYG_001857 [Oceanicoccus sp.]|jgi:hypothetical protein
MKFISLLIALLIVGLLVKKQLESGSYRAEYEDIISNENITAPRIPMAPEDIQNFEKDINKFMLDSAKQRKKAAEAL